MSVKAYAGTTRARVIISPNDTAATMIGQFLHNRAKEWDYNPRTFKSTVTHQFFLFNRRLGELRIPIGFLDSLVAHLSGHGVPIPIATDRTVNPRTIRLNIRPGFTDRENQVEPIKFLSNRVNGMYGLPLQTGMGKSWCAVRAITEHKEAAMVVTTGLVTQWVSTFLEFTDIAEDEYYVVQGQPSLKRLFKSDAQPKIFICSLETLIRYAMNDENYRKLPSYPKFLKMFGIGVKVVDEVHMKYAGITIVDLFSNVRHNLYLSATPSRNDPVGRRIFGTIYP